MTEVLLPSDGRWERHVTVPTPTHGGPPHGGPPQSPPIRALDDFVAEAGDLRPLPEVARRLLDVVEEDDFSLQDLAIIVGADQALTAKILRVANSPFHRHARQIGTIRDAVVLLGFRTVRSAALAACLMQSTPVRTNVLDYGDFWRYSVAVGLLAKMMAGRTIAVRDMAFTAGVMHSLGRLALDQMDPRNLARAAGIARERGIRLADAERMVLGFTEGELGAALATHWSYPPELIEAIALDDVAGPAPAGALARIVRDARRAALSAHLRDGLPTPPGTGPWDEIDAPDAVRELVRFGGIDELWARVDAFLEGVFPDGMVRAA